MVATGSRVLFDALAQVFESLGFGVLGDDTFRELVIARIVEPTSVLDTGRVLTELGVHPASEKTMRRALTRCAGRGYSGQIATACFDRAVAAGDVSLCLYDVTGEWAGRGLSPEDELAALRARVACYPK